MCFSKISDSYFSIKRLVNSGLTQEDAWNQTSIKLTQASEVYNITKKYYYIGSIVYYIRCRL